MERNKSHYKISKAPTGGDPANITGSNSTIEAPEKGVKYVQS